MPRFSGFHIQGGEDAPFRATAKKKLHVSLYVLHVLQGGVSFLTNCRARRGRMGMRDRMRHSDFWAETVTVIKSSSNH
jgi:hypothetical protein